MWKKKFVKKAPFAGLIYQTQQRLDFTKDFNHIKIKMTNHEEPNHLQLLNENGKR